MNKKTRGGKEINSRKTRGETKLKKTMNKLLACMLVVALGLSSYPVYAMGTTDESNEQVEDTNAKISYQLPEDNIVVDNVEPNDDVKPQAEVEPEDDVEPPADDSTTINLTDDNISSNVPKFDDLASDDSQLVIPQGEDEHDDNTFSGITPYSTTIGGITVTGGVLNVDYSYNDMYSTFHILTSTHLTFTSNSVPRTARIGQGVIGIHVNITLDDLYLRDPHMSLLNLGDGMNTVNLRGTVILEAGHHGIMTMGPVTITGADASTLHIGTLGASAGWLLTSMIPSTPVTLNNLTVHLVNEQTRYINNIQLSTSGNTSINTIPIVDSKIPIPALTTTSKSTDQIQVSTTNYLHGIFGKTLYSLNGTDWEDNGGTFTNLTPGTPYTIHAKYEAANGLQESPVASISVTTPVEYTVNIPATTQADGVPVDITVDNDLALGASGQVDVMIIGGVDSGGLVPLTRSNASNTIYSQLLVNDVPITDITQSIATFTMDTQTHTPIPISFATPTGSDIPAGQYQGVVTFSIEYSD